jgi:alpha-tubulin suppressor-like RCC1 family protein
MNSFLSVGRRMAAISAIPFVLNSKEAEGFFWGKKTVENETNLTDRGSVYMWGYGAYQARPDSKTQFINFSPKKISLVENDTNSKAKLSKDVKKFKDVVFNRDNGFGVDLKGKVWAFENHRISSFVDSDEPNNFITFENEKYNKDNVLNHLQSLDLKENVTKIVITKRLLWALSDKGELFSLNLEQLKSTNKKSKESIQWKKLSTINQLNDIASGKGHLLMLKKDGQLFSMGSDTYGQCGLGDIGRSTSGTFIKTKVPNPEHVTALSDKKVNRIFASGNHSFVITEGNQVYAFGSNKFLQLAHEKEYSDLLKPKLAFYSPVNFSKYLEPNKCDLQDIVLGKETSFFVCKHSETKLTQVYGCGMNSHGQLADGRTKHITDFEKIENLSDYTIQTPEGDKPMDIKKLSCGDDHCLALTSTDALLIWGDNEFGQLGNKKRSYSTKPLLVTAFKNSKIIDIKADFKNNYVWTE